MKCVLRDAATAATGDVVGTRRNSDPRIPYCRSADLEAVTGLTGVFLLVVETSRQPSGSEAEDKGRESHVADSVTASLDYSLTYIELELSK